MLKTKTKTKAKIKNVKNLVKNKMLMGGAMLMLAASSVLGAESMDSKPSEFYRASELSLDLFGTASLGKYTIDHLSGTRVRRNTRLGAGLGVSYFLTRNIGLGAEAYSENTSGILVDN